MIANDSALPFPDRRSTAPPSHSLGVRGEPLPLYHLAC